MKEVIKEKIHFAFNVWDFESARLIMESAAKIKEDVILQTSSGIFAGFPKKELREFVSSYSKSLEINAWLNLDHCRDEELLNEAIDCGWDIVMADSSALPIEENIIFTNRITEAAHKAGVLVEAEVGQVMGVEDDICVHEASVASRDDIKIFLENTDVDLIAVAFGNAHGEYKTPPELDYDLVEYTTGLSEVPFVVHGGSGMSADVMKRLVSINGVKKINISTEVKQAYRNAIMRSYSDGLFESDGFQPVRINKYVQNEFDALMFGKYDLLENNT